MPKFKQILILDDLYNFCVEHNFSYFSSAETGYQLSVHVPASCVFETGKNDSTLLFCKVKAFHIGLNRNNSNVVRKAAEKSFSTMAYKPLLANFAEFDDPDHEGEKIKDFTSHDMLINEDGSATYIEQQIGCITADEPYIEHDNDADLDYVYVRVAIPRDYTEACDIIERKGGTKVSVELLVNEMKYDAKKHELQLTDIEVKGLTCLGRNPNTGEEVREGMRGARLDIEDFSAKNNSVTYTVDDIQMRLIESLEKLSHNIEAVTFSNTVINKEGGEKDMKLKELMEKYQVAESDLTFETEGLSDEELEAKFAEVFDTDADSEDPAKDPEVEPGNDLEQEPEDPETVVENHSIVPEKYSISLSDGSVKEFALSLSDIQNALSSLVNSTYGEADNAYYSVIVYEDNTVVMFNWWDDKAYRQSYSREGDNFSLTGNRAEVRQNWLTAEEETALQEMKNNYAALEEKVRAYELNQARAAKAAVLDQEKYAILSEVKEFKDLKSNMDNYSLDELTKEVKAIHSDYVSEHPEVFSVSPDNKPRKKVAYGFSFDAAEKPYGNLFK